MSNDLTDPEVLFEMVMAGFLGPRDEQRDLAGALQHAAFGLEPAENIGMQQWHRVACR